MDGGCCSTRVHRTGLPGDFGRALKGYAHTATVWFYCRRREVGA